MFERFSRNARVSVVLAQEEARELDCSWACYRAQGATFRVCSAVMA